MKAHSGISTNFSVDIARLVVSRFPCGSSMSAVFLAQVFLPAPTRLYSAKRTRPVRGGSGRLCPAGYQPRDRSVA